MAKTEATKEVTLFGDKSDNVPAHLQTDAPMGNENVSSADMAIPRLNLLQQMSPEVREIAEAQPGMLYNTVTKQLYNSVNVVNLAFQKDYAVFKKRDLGGGLEGNFATLEDAKAHVASLSHPEDYDIVDTDKHFCMELDEEGQPVSPVLIYMSGSKLKVSKAWNSEIQLKGKNADRFATVWNVGSFTDTNRRNDKFENFKVEFMGWAPESLYNAAKEAFVSISRQVQEAA